MVLVFDMAKEWAQVEYHLFVDIKEAAEFLGMTRETLQKRMGRAGFYADGKAMKWASTNLVVHRSKRGKK